MRPDAQLGAAQGQVGGYDAAGGGGEVGGVEEAFAGHFWAGFWVGFVLFWMPRLGGSDVLGDHIILGRCFVREGASWESDVRCCRIGKVEALH